MAGEWPMELLITFNLEEADGATKLKLTHEGVPAEMHDECVKGWNESLDKLEKNFE
jgi:activator of HSP90 ATPase